LYVAVHQSVFNRFLYLYDVVRHCMLSVVCCCSSISICCSFVCCCSLPCYLTRACCCSSFLFFSCMLLV